MHVVQLLCSSNESTYCLEQLHSRRGNLQQAIEHNFFVIHYNPRTFVVNCTSIEDPMKYSTEASLKIGLWLPSSAFIATMSNLERY